MINKITDILYNESKNHYHLYDCDHFEINDFYNDDIKKTEKAISIIKKIITKNGKQDLYQYLLRLSIVESATIEILPYQRDHVIHALNTFLLGVYINEKYLDRIAKKVNYFQWKLACLFHDIGYQLEITNNLIIEFQKNINLVNDKLDINYSHLDFFSIKTSKNLIDLNDGKNSLILIQKKINDWGLLINVKKEFNNKSKKGIICHGIISSLLILKTLDGLYHKNNPDRKHEPIIHDNIDYNQTYFEDDIVSACSSIFIHNLKKDSFLKKKINPFKMPLVFLLKISDTLQEWERPNNKLENGNSPYCFSIKIEDKKIIFETEIPELITKLTEEINDFFEVEFIEIKLKIANNG
ncbi:MAG: hypothetical protein WCO13_05955 [Bacteroidota bacterium]